MPRLGLGSSLTGGGGAGEDITSFISTWATTTSSEKVTIPFVSSGTINFTIDWGDGGSDAVTAWNDNLGGGAIDHTYLSADTYTITMAGTISGLKFNNGGDKTKIKTITQWGTFNISVDDTFWGCNALNVTATDAPTISSTSLAMVFNGCTALTSIGGDWDVSSVTNVTYLFANCTNFNQDIGNWDVSAVELMYTMFQEASSFNQDISGWDVGAVTSMKSMFWGATDFNNGEAALTETGNNWDMTEVKNCENMFRNAESFNADISDWTVSSVENMKRMFQDTIPFNQDIGSWNVSSVITMYGMFANNANFNQDISSWTVAQVEDFTSFLANNTEMSTANYNKFMYRLDSTSSQSSVSFDGGNATHDGSTGGVDGTTAINNLVTNHSWTIIDSDGGTDHDAGEHT